MIFLTVGTQLPFDRLVRAMDTWSEMNPDERIVGQIGYGEYQPKSFESHPFITPSQFRQYMTEADLIVGHAGMGTILYALQHRKPLIVMPRRFDCGEHRSDHQLATVRQLSVSHQVCSASDETDLMAQLDRRHELSLGREIQDTASTPLTEGIRDFLKTGKLASEPHVNAKVPQPSAPVKSAKPRFGRPRVDPLPAQS